MATPTLTLISLPGFVFLDLFLPILTSLIFITAYHSSRLALAIHWRDVLSTAELVDTILSCYSPRPRVEHITDVGDYKKLFNPTGASTFPAATARVKRALGISTHELLPGHELFMEATSPLHWKFSRVLPTNRVVVQTKLTGDVVQWSETFTVWNSGAPRPDNREHEDGFSGLLPTDLRLAPQRPVDATRAAGLQKSLEGCSSRLTAEAYAEWEAIVQHVINPDDHSDQRPDNSGRFCIEVLLAPESTPRTYI